MSQFLLTREKSLSERREMHGISDMKKVIGSDVTGILKPASTTQESSEDMMSAVSSSTTRARHTIQEAIETFLTDM